MQASPLNMPTPSKLSRGGAEAAAERALALGFDDAGDLAARAGLGVRPGQRRAVKRLDVGGGHGVADRRLVGQALDLDGGAGRGDVAGVEGAVDLGLFAG